MVPGFSVMADREMQFTRWSSFRCASFPGLYMTGLQVVGSSGAAGRTVLLVSVPLMMASRWRM